MSGLVALIGRPNVGKSTVFNRIVGERVSIIEDTPGVTRDRIYSNASWLGVNFVLIDTGGIEIEDAPFQKQIRMQAEIAIDEADIIVYIGDGKTGVTSDDTFICSLLRKSQKPVILAVNKVDDGQLIDRIYDFYSLGLGDPIAISGIHGIGFGDLLDKIIENLPRTTEVEEESIKFSLIGRPNVGKSSLANAILQTDRVIVSDISGTTRDAIDTTFVRNETRYTVIDTAGLKKRGKIYESIDKYAAIRALGAIDRSDVAVIVLDGEEGIVEQDKNVAGYAFEAHKAIVIAVNKWDIVKKDTNTMNEFIKKIRDEFKFLSFAPIVFVSALKNQRIDTLFSKIDLAYNNSTQRIKTSVINEVIMDAVLLNQPAEHNGGQLKINYVSQVDIKPPHFVFFVNNPKFLHFSYERYLKNKIRESFDFEGTPIKFKVQQKN